MQTGIKASWKGLILGVVIFSAILGPVVVFGGSKNVYVDKDNKGTETGSKDHPYRTISKALKKIDGSATVFVANGTYKENITIPKHVDVKGKSENPDKVIIEADNDNLPTVIMKHDTVLSHVTVKGGRHGVRVLEDAKAHLFNDVIKKNDRDGIHIDKGSRNEKNRVLIDKVRISGNGKAGIYSEKRFVVIINSDMVWNAGDGIDFTAGVKAWLEDNRLNDNRGSGAQFVMDGASISSKNNSIRRNGREGVEVNAYGEAGSISLKKAAFVGNKHFGIAKIARTPAGTNAFGGLSFDAARFEGNVSGNISNILRAF